MTEALLLSVVPKHGFATCQTGLGTSERFEVIRCPLSIVHCLFNMLVAEDVLPAVAVLTFALRAVAKVHVGVALVGDAAGGTTMMRPALFFGHPRRLFHDLPTSVSEIGSDVPRKEDQKVGCRRKYHEARGPVSKDDLIGIAKPGE